MIIQEALRLSNKIKRPCHEYPIEFQSEGGIEFLEPLSKEDLLADDWEIEPEPRKKIKLYAFLQIDNNPNKMLPDYKVFFDTHLNQGTGLIPFLSIQRLPHLDCEIEE